MSNDRPTGLPIGRVIEDITGFTGPISDFVEGPEPDVPVAREIHQRLRAQCDAYSNAPSWFTGQAGGFQVGVGLVCDDYLESQGSGPPEVEPLFSGGQCAGERYRVVVQGTYTEKRCSTGVETPRTSNSELAGCSGMPRIYGPVTGTPIALQGDCGVYNRGVRLEGFDADGTTPVVINATWGNSGPGVSLKNESVSVTLTRCDGGTECGDPPGEIKPNPNPRPDPGLDPEDEPFEREPGQPVFPMPEIENPFGEPVQLPNFPGPPIFGTENEGESTNPNVGPPITPGPPQDGNGTDGEDDDFGEPPDGHIWVGFIVELSDQGVSEGLQPNSPPEPIYRATTGNYRAKYDVEGETVYSSPREIRQRTSTYFLDLAGLTLTGARVNVPSNDSYIVTPLSQPVTEEEEA